MKLTNKERLALANQFKILEALYPDEAGYYAQQRKAFEHGFALHYSWAFDQIEPELSEEDCREVLDILELYDLFLHANRLLPEKEKFKIEELRFPGFDLNDPVESKCLAYANYFMVDLDRYKQIRDQFKEPYFNSHRRMLGQYRRMLKVWREDFRKLHTLSKDQLTKILAA